MDPASFFLSFTYHDNIQYFHIFSNYRVCAFEHMRNFSGLLACLLAASTQILGHVQRLPPLLLQCKSAPFQFGFMAEICVVHCFGFFL